jgi:hypothetical protein
MASPFVVTGTGRNERPRSLLRGRSGDTKFRDAQGEEHGDARGMPRLRGALLPRDLASSSYR